MKTKFIFLLLLGSVLFAKYDNCNFTNKHYEDICKKVVKNGVSYKYANEFLLSYFKTQKYDEITWKYIQPSKIKYHKEKEKQANNVLVKYVPKMVRNLQKYKDVYDYAEKKYHVNREIIAAILLKETKLGKIKPTHDAFIVFNTIVTRTKPDTHRNKWLLKMGKTNMASIIEHCYKKGVKPEQCNLASSYAGAIGIPQFMPNSFIYTDSYKGRVADLSKMEDAILSAAKFLHVKAKFDTLINWEKMPDIPKVEQEWYAYAYKYNNASFCYERSKKSKKVYKCFTKDKKNLQYMRKYVQKIMRYNNSSNYAVGVIRLAYEAHQLLEK
ncbi:lytic murein transglycosylase [Sulfurimonas sp. SWIR-19]|uniref:lytic murein transglycosylase n=1 Tax=Sulfurimonas sp. SWIR-19 TaxID=2878390 RepID=UPI001CF52C18|nr:lytic murein transglycosylase [Sulfurimonas sp. SWIR-19]UCN00185.1 lytic murein transglycosylase [Sulfurimonas sp. SWIR-19]